MPHIMHEAYALLDVGISFMEGVSCRVDLCTAPHRTSFPSLALPDPCSLCMVADGIVRNPLNPIAEMPVGSVTSMIGVPFFVYLLIGNGKKFGM